MFKKGDKVKVIKNDHFSINKIGDEGTIVEVNSKEDSYKVEVSGNGNSLNWHYGYELELIEKMELDQRKEELINNSKMEQTAVEFLVEALVQECGLDEEGYMAKYIIEKAKEMFEQHIIEAYREALINGFSFEDAEQYYNETFKTE